MANHNFGGTARSAQGNRRHARDRVKQSNWLRSLVAGFAMSAVGSLGVVLVFDWYFFSVVESLSTSLRPIAQAFHQASSGALEKTGSAVRYRGRTAAIEDVREYFAVPSEEGSNQTRSFTVPVGQ
jgi:hypothetical protein